MRTQQLIKAFANIQSTMGRMAKKGHPLVNAMQAEFMSKLGIFGAMPFPAAIKKAQKGDAKDLEALLVKHPQAQAILEQYLPQFKAMHDATQPKPTRRIPTLEEQRKVAAAKAATAKAEAARKQQARDAVRAQFKNDQAKIDEQYAQAKKRWADRVSEGKQEMNDDLDAGAGAKKAPEKATVQQPNFKVDANEFQKDTKAFITDENARTGSKWKLNKAEHGFNLQDGDTKVDYDFSHGFYASTNADDPKGVEMLIQSTIAADKIAKAQGEENSQGLTVTCKSRELAEQVHARFAQAGVKMAKIVVAADGNSEDITEELQPKPKPKPKP